ncbi:MAG: 5-deoxy-glucuronate isomerase [Armatimonadota bacterium]
MNTDKLIFRKTNTEKGRHISVTPENSAMKHLRYGRIILDAQTPSASLETGDRETGLVCLSGAGTVTVGEQQIPLGRYDAIYIPRGSSVQVSTDGSVDLAEFSATVEGDYPLQIVRYEDVKQNGALKFSAGGPGSKRDLNILIGKNVQAGRIVAGVTTSEPGNWTSWPPHEHAEMLEEMYVYYDMPAPSFGVQFVYTDTEEPEFVQLVRDGDAVLMPEGYHPNVSAPGHTISFLWIMAAHRERDDRQFGVVNVQPEFSESGSGLEASHK